ncbi:tRNA (adenine(22)-N(1))-methyltransferase [Alloiococcus sp. CFN-8]|uniref:tRNA (adenine(22)-N(1))-methyltransferase n=1 Tax=Alloiococcus sp. CFN-8 TaxID=3416081 RepID=UPI003CE72C21
MELSKRLKEITFFIDKCNVIADIGTDHGYVPIYSVKSGLCLKAIASDINKGPVDKARMNVKREGLEKVISCRKGPGLSTLEVNEAEIVIIAGMGGNLIRDIIVEDIAVVKELKSLILQPAQNPEILRRFLYSHSFSILGETVVHDEGKFYEIFKVSYKEKNNIRYQEYMDYELSDNLIKSGSPDIKPYLEFKISSYKRILNYIGEGTETALARRQEVINKISLLTEVLNWG